MHICIRTLQHYKNTIALQLKFVCVWFTFGFRIDIFLSASYRSSDDLIPRDNVDKLRLRADVTKRLDGITRARYLRLDLSLDSN